MSSTNFNLLSLFVRAVTACTDMQAQPLVRKAIILYITNVAYPGKTVGKHHKIFELRSINNKHNHTTTVYQPNSRDTKM
jgi:hypothetical protein